MSATTTVLLAAAESWFLSWSPAVWRWLASAALLALTLWLLLPSGVPLGMLRRGLSIVTGACGLVLLWWSVPRMGTFSIQAGFWCLAVLTLASATATISARSPVYSAIWFAVSLLGTAGLFLLQGAQFLGVATVAVYAGAIVVTFLFVLMLAQPEGHAYYDRISWGTAPRFVAAVTSVLLAMLIAVAVSGNDERAERSLDERQALLAELQESLRDVVPAAEPRAVRYESWGDRRLARVMLAVPPEQRAAFDDHRDELERRGLQQVRARHADWQLDGLVWDLQDVQTVDHAASLGGYLFGRQLVTIQAAGAVLTAALVGAVAIASRTGALED